MTNQDRAFSLASLLCFLFLRNEIKVKRVFYEKVK